MSEEYGISMSDSAENKLTAYFERKSDLFKKGFWILVAFNIVLIGLFLYIYIFENSEFDINEASLYFALNLPLLLFIFIMYLISPIRILKSSFKDDINKAIKYQEKRLTLYRSRLFGIPRAQSKFTKEDSDLLELLKQYKKENHLD